MTDDVVDGELDKGTAGDGRDVVAATVVSPASSFFFAAPRMDAGNELCKAALPKTASGVSFNFAVTSPSSSASAESVRATGGDVSVGDCGK